MDMFFTFNFIYFDWVISLNIKQTLYDRTRTRLSLTLFFAVNKFNLTYLT